MAVFLISLSLLSTLFTQVIADVVYINNVSSFISFAKSVSDSGRSCSGTTIYLNCDLDFKNAKFITVGAYQIKPFKGTFNGNGHLIQNIGMTADDNIQYTGLFGYINGGKISNVILDSTNTFESTYTGRTNFNYAGCAIGSIVGRCYNCNIENVASLAGIINSGEYSSSTGGVRRIGGIVGHSCGTASTIKNSAYAGKMIFKGSGTRPAKIGGLVGVFESTELLNSVFLGTITKSGTATATTNYIANVEPNSYNNIFESCYSIRSSSHAKLVNRNYKVTSTGKTLLETLNNYSKENSLSTWGYVNHKTNGGTNVENRMSFFTYISSGLNTPTKVGNTFKGWYTNYILTKPWSSRSTIKVFKSNTYVYAKWDVNYYNLSFDSNGGSTIENRTVKYNTNLNLAEPTREDGQIFYDWYEQDKTGKQTLFRELRMPARNVVLVAKWGNSTRYEITFNTTGGTEIPSIKYAVNDTINLQNISIPEKIGYTFVHWYEGEDNIDEAFNSTIMPEHSITLYAKWSLKSYDLIFDGYNNYTLNFSEQIPIEVPEKEGCNFIYWYEEDMATPFNLTTMPDRNVELYPLFEPISYTLKLEYDNGEDPYYGEFVCCKKYVLPIPTKDGHGFSHWYEEGTDPNKPFDNEVMPARNLTLRAVWSNASTYVEIVFDTKCVMDDVVTEIKKYTDNFEVINFFSDEESTRVIIKFSDGNESRDFVANAEDASFFGDANIKYIGNKIFISYKNVLNPIFTSVVLLSFVNF